MSKTIESYKISSRCVKCDKKMEPVEDKDGDYHECPNCGAKIRPKIENIWIGEPV